MLTQKRTSIQTRLEQILESKGELSTFKKSEIFRTEVSDGVSAVLRIVKFHNLITCYFRTEAIGNISDSPSITISISESGKWRYVARHRKHTFSRQLKAA